MKNLILLFALSFLVISCANKKNLSETEYVPINDDWEEIVGKGIVEFKHQVLKEL